MKEILKQNYKFIIVILLLLLSFTIPFPYYIDCPGGITDISKKMEIEGYKSEGSFNLAYVREYRATIPTLLISLFNKDWNIYKEDEVLLDNETDESYLLRDKLLIQESVSNAIYVAYTNANKKIEVLNNNLKVLYVYDESSTNLSVGDTIISINNEKINEKADIVKVLNPLKNGDKVNITVKNNDKEYNKYAYIKEDNNKKQLGILVVNIREYETTPKVNIKIGDKEYGSSGGFITTLAIYNSLIEEDITKGLTIVGTGTIDIDGTVGEIGGVKYKLKSAVKSHADLFLVPNGENYEEAIKEKEKNNYKIKVIGVSTFNEAIEILKEI